MRSLGSLLVLIFAVQAPLAPALDTNKIKILQCMTVYEFDFVADELGFSIAQVDEKGNEVQLDPETSEKIRADQFNRFVETGKLKPLATVKREPKPSKKEAAENKTLAQRCQIIAETVVEVMAIKSEMQRGGVKSDPRGLDQSL